MSGLGGASVFSLVLPTLRLSGSDIYHFACAFFVVRLKRIYLLYVFLYHSGKVNDGLRGANFQEKWENIDY